MKNYTISGFKIPMIPCPDCGAEGPHDCKPKPALAETPAEAERLAYAGRSWPALKESKSFDTHRLNESPLFDRRLF